MCIIAVTYRLTNCPSSLPKDAWSCLRHVLQHVRFLRRDEPAALEEHIKQGRVYDIPPIFCGYLAVVKLTCSDGDYNAMIRGVKDVQTDLMSMRPGACRMIMRLGIRQHMNTGELLEDAEVLST